jgi:hypothetical protein
MVDGKDRSGMCVLMIWDNSVELALANLDLNEPMLDMVIFYDGDPLEGSSFTPTDAQIALDIEEEEEEEDGGEITGSDANLDDYDMEDYCQLRLMSYEILPSTVLLSSLCLFCIFHWYSHLYYQ